MAATCAPDWAGRSAGTASYFATIEGECCLSCSRETALVIHLDWHGSNATLLSTFLPLTA